MIVTNKHPFLREYAKPLAEALVVFPEGLVCTSPGWVAR